jgi:hypothetical protein
VTEPTDDFFDDLVGRLSVPAEGDVETVGEGHPPDGDVSASLLGQVRTADGGKAGGDGHRTPTSATASHRRRSHARHRRARSRRHNRRRRRRWSILGAILLGFVALAVIGGVVLANEGRDKPQRTSRPAPPPAMPTVPPAAGTDGATAAGVSEDTALALTLVGLTPDQIETVGGASTLDADDDLVPVPGAPEIARIGAFALARTPEQESAVFGSTGSVPCGSRNDTSAIPVAAACTAAGAESAGGTSLFIWAELDTGLLESVAGAGVRASVDLDADGAIDLPITLQSTDGAAPVLIDIDEAVAVRALVAGDTVLFAVRTDALGTTPQWALASATAAGTLTDVTEWQRWVVDADGNRTTDAIVNGTDVRSPDDG